MISETLSKKYADIISREDANYIVFSLLGTEKLSEISRKSGLTRRTLYTLKDRKYIQSRTKRKILKASLEVSRNITFNFLLRRSKDQAANILVIYLSQLYSETIQKTNGEEFKESLSIFLKARTKHFGLISDELESEVNTMLRFLEETAYKFGIELPPEPLQTANHEHIIQTVPFIVNSLYFGEETANNLARTYSVPLEYTQAISSALGNIGLLNPRIMEPEDYPETLSGAGAFILEHFEAKRMLAPFQKVPAAASV